jgi:hypothetical protein
LIAVQGDGESGELVIAPSDGSQSAKPLGFKTKDNADPAIIRHQGIFRMAWVAADSRRSRTRPPYRIVWTADWNAMELPKLAGIEPTPEGLKDKD